MKKMSMISVVLFLSMLLILACKDPVGGDPNNPGNAASGTLKFNLAGAKAVGSADIAATRAIRGLSDYRSIRSVLSRTTDEYGLVKIKEDGSVELAMEMPEGIWMPKVMFIAKSPVAGSKDLYIAFENSIRYFDKTTNKEVKIGSFLHLLEDGTYFSVIDKENGRVKNYSWFGNDNYRPVSFDSSGRMYYVFETWGSSNGSNQLFRYDPATHVSTALTAALTGMQYNNFEVSPDGKRLFVQGMRNSSGANSNFFRMYPVDDVENPVSIYYSSNNNIWVRGYKVSPAGATQQNVILNGYGIRGINGLLRANVVNDSTITYDPLFDSSSNNGNWFNPEYNEWFSDWEVKTYYNGFFDRFNVNDIYLVMTDKSDFFYLRLYDLMDWQGSRATIHVAKNPTANDWNAQGWIEKTIANGVFGFASSTTDKTALIGSTVVSNVMDLYNEVKSNTKALTFVRRWNNGAETTTKFDVSASLINTLLTNKGNADYSTMYQWNTHWFKNQDRAQGLDATAILAYAGKYFMDDVFFKFGANAAGTVSFAAFEAQGYYRYSEVFGPSDVNSPTFFLDNYFVKSDGVTKALTFHKFKTQNALEWLNFQNVSSLFYDGSNACWAIIGGNSNWSGGSSTARPVKILDASGKKTLEFITALNGSTYNPVSYLLSGNRMFFRDGLKDADGYESGYHKLYMLDVTTPAMTPVDVLANVAENGKLEIASFSVAGDIMYFTGVRGTGVIGGKIDLATLGYTPMSSDYMLRDIQVY